MWTIAGKKFKSRLLLTSERYPSPDLLKNAVIQSEAQIVTVSLMQRASGKDHSLKDHSLLDIIRSWPITLLPSTFGCRSMEEAIQTAKRAREILGTTWIKLEIIGDEYTLQPDPLAVVETTRILISEGFEVFPSITEDLTIADKLVTLGCKVLIPCGAPIGSRQGITSLSALKLLRLRLPITSLILGGGLGLPSHAVQAMEIGLDGVLLNTAISTATDPILMAEAFAAAVLAGRKGYEAGPMNPRDFCTSSHPGLGTPFWHS